MPQPIRLVYSKDYAVDIGDHVFPTSKYNLIKERLMSQSPFRDRIEFVMPDPASDEEILAVHDKAYLDKLRTGALTKEELFRLELPYSMELVDAAVVCCGGTIATARIAISDRIGIHIGGGFHHAFPDHGEGFCVLNDIAVAIRAVMRRGSIRKTLVIDCDLHQGNGTAAVFSGDPSVYTFSIHQENNYPFFKPRSNCDIGLRDRAADKEYMAVLHDRIPKIVSDFKPDMIFYVAGADPFKDDKIGGLALTKQALAARDDFIYAQAVNYGIPIAVVLAGGYAAREGDTVDIHYTTIARGLELFYKE